MKDSVKTVLWAHSPTLLEPLSVLFVVVVNNTTLQQMHVKTVQWERSHELELFATFVQSMNTRVQVNVNANLVALDLSLPLLKTLVYLVL